MKSTLILIVSALLSHQALTQEMDSEWTRDSKHLVIATGKQISLLDVAEKRRTIIPEADPFLVTDILVNGKDHIYSSGLNGIVRKWDLNGNMLNAYGQAANGINAIAVNDEKGLLIAGDADGYLYAWESSTGKLTKDLKVHSAGITSLVIAGGMIYSSGFDGRIIATNIASWTSQPLHEVTGGTIHDLQSAGADNLIFMAQQKTRKGTIRYAGGFDLKKKRSLNTLPADVDVISSLSMGLNRYGSSPDRFILLETSSVLSIIKGKITRSTLPSDVGLYTNANFSPDLKWCSGDNTVIPVPDANGEVAKDADTWDHSDTAPERTTTAAIPQAVKLSLIYPESERKQIQEVRRTRSVSDDRIIPVIQNGFIKAYHAGLSPDSTLLVVSNESNTLKVFDVRNKKLLTNLDTGSPVVRLAIHPFEPIAATLHTDGKLRLWDLINFSQLRSFDHVNLERFNQLNKTSKDNISLGPLFGKRISVEQNNQAQLLYFSTTGHELWVLDPNPDLSEESGQLNFQHVNIATGRSGFISQEISPLNEVSPFELTGSMVTPFDIEFPLTEHRHLNQFSESASGNNGAMDFFGSSQARSMYTSIIASMTYVVPAVHATDKGMQLIYDNGSYLHALDLRTLRNNSLYLPRLPVEFRKYASRVQLQSDELTVPTTANHPTFFTLRQYIDTVHARVVQQASGEYEARFMQQDLRDSGEAFFRDGCCSKAIPMYREERFQWSLRSNKTERLTKETYQDALARIKEDSTEWDPDKVEAHEIWPGGPDAFSEYYVQEGELLARDKEHYRFNFNYSSDSWDYSMFSAVIPTGEVMIRNSNTSALAARIPPQSAAVVFQQFLEQPGFFLTNNMNGEIKLWNWRKQPITEPVVTFIGSKEDLFAMTPDFYYFPLTPKANNIAFRKNGVLFGFEQFDLKFNRPDLVLKRIGLADSTVIKAYRQAYLKRLKKMGFTEDMLRDDFQLPEIRIENFEYLPASTDSTSIGLNLLLQDKKYPLDRVNIWVNDVAIHGAAGISLRTLGKTNHRMYVRVALGNGPNKIQVSVLNQAGAESYKQTVSIEGRKGKTKPDLYLVTLGGSRFRDQRYNLTYAAKDANDVARLFTAGSVYGKVFTKTITDMDLTRENILAVRSFLEQADVNDQVMVFFAGHGVLDRNLNYYFATHDMDFSDPATRGIAYEEVEGLLDGIAARKKSMLIDACHSGELDKEEVTLMSRSTKPAGPIQFRAVGGELKPKLGLENISELTRSLFSDLRKGTGATVISSAGGMEFAMEGKDWNNGLFTHCLIRGLNTGAADLDANGQIWLSELKQYVTEQVSSLSEGRQQPTSRIENQALDIRIK